MSKFLLSMDPKASPRQREKRWREKKPERKAPKHRGRGSPKFQTGMQKFPRTT